MNGSVGEGMHGATQMALIGMKRGWWWKDLWDSQHTHGFPPEKRQQVQAPLSTSFSSPGNSLPLLKFGHNDRLHLDQLECTFPLLLYGQHKASQLSFLDSCFISFLKASERCCPACSGAFVPSFSVLTCEILQSVSVNQAESCQIMQCYTQPQSRVETYKFIFTCNLSQDFFSDVQRCWKEIGYEGPNTWNRRLKLCSFPQPL